MLNIDTFITEKQNESLVKLVTDFITEDIERYSSYGNGHIIKFFTDDEKEEIPYTDFEWEDVAWDIVDIILEKIGIEVREE